MPGPDELKPRSLSIDDESVRYPIEKVTGGTQRWRSPAVDMAEQAGRVPPQALDIEQSVLGAMLIEPEAIPQALDVLVPIDFYVPKHRIIYQAIINLFERSNPIDLITLKEELARMGDLDKVGGALYLSELTTQVATAANVEYHSRIIAEKSLLRRVIETMTEVVGEAYDPSTDAFDLLDKAEQRVFELSESNLRRSAIPIKDVMVNTVERLQAIHGREGGITGTPSGFSGLDDLTGGWQPGDFIVIAARPSMGKTAFCLDIARNAALHPTYGCGVAIFSLEMSNGQLAQRLLTSEARVDAQAARTGRLREEEWRQIARAAAKLFTAPIFIDDTPGLSILELRTKCRRLRAEHHIGLIIVDYLQLMQGIRGAQSREQEIASISRSLKSLAKELDVPVIALSQLNRAVETRGGDKRPMISDLRESGSIEQDADVVLFIYRAERYQITVDEDGNSTEGLAEIIVGKQRNGPTGAVKLSFINRFARFENLTTFYSSSGDGFESLPPSDAPF